MRLSRSLLLTTLCLGIGGILAYVGNEPSTSGDDDGGSGSDASADGTAADGSIGSDGSSGDGAPNVDSGPSTFCQKQTAPDASDYFCADFDGPKFDQGFLDASVTGGGTLATSTLAAFSPPNGLAAAVPASDGSNEIDATLYYAKGGTVAVSEMTMRARILSHETSGMLTKTGDVILMHMGTGNVVCEYGYTKGGAVNGQDPYTGYFVHAQINITNQNYYPVDAISTVAWTDVKLTWTFESAKSTIALTYDGVSKLAMDAQFRGNNDLLYQSYLGPFTFADTLDESYGYDDFETWTERNP